MFKTIAIVIGLLLAAMLALVGTQPDSFRVQRETSIKAPPEKIFPLISDFHAWSSWSQWEKLDPGLKRTYSGAPSGKGAAYAWKGNNKVGAGRMEITGSSVPSKVTIKLDFLQPFEGHNVADFTLEPKGNQTTVTWVMRGPSSYVSKLMGVFVSMDSLIGKDFEAGLANMKAIAEK